MPTSTQELVSIIKSDFASDVSRVRILSYLNRAQRELFNSDCAQMLFYNDSDPAFPFPLIKTTAGQLGYNIDGTTLVNSVGAAISLTKTDSNGNARAVVCRKINHIFLMVNALEASNYNKKFYGEQFTLSGLNAYWSTRLYKCSFYEVPGNIINRTEYSPARFIFEEDPGTYSGKYFIEFYYGCPDLSAETVPLSIDADQWGEALICGVCGYIEQWRNGKTDRLAELRSYWKPRFRDSINSVMAQRTPQQMPVRSCG